MRLALIVEYDGADYHGFQYQRGAPTIQEELENAIAKLVGVRSRVQGAGRTDAGVHATGQVVAFDTEADHSPGTFVRALNYHLPDDIAVKAAYRVGPEFDPRRMALSRRYVYSIYAGATPSPLIRRTSWPGGDKLRVRKMQAAARHLVGVHDFARFAGPLGKPGGSTVREITETRVSRRGDLIVFEVRETHFCLIRCAGWPGRWSTWAERG